MGNMNHQNIIVRDIVETLGLNENECVEKDGAIIIARQGGEEKLEIGRDVSVLLKRHNNVRFKFINCIFKEPIALQQITFRDILYFLNSSFEGEVDFSRSLFKERVFFSESIFKDKASFVEVIFEQNAYFDEAIFKKEANFSLSEFYKNAHFYGTHFNEFPNFIQAIFSENVNFTNTELDFGFDEVKNEIEETYNKRKEEYGKNQNKEHKEEPKKHKIANEFRDSFRNIKSLLIEHHNTLDASKYHRVELYCKELEMEYRNSGLRDFVDKIQLYYYRITSDHHTNLLLILTNVIALIVLFSIVACGLFYCANDLQKKIKVGRECCEPERGYHLFTTFPEHIIDYISPQNLAVWGEILAIAILCIIFVYVFISIVRFIHRINAEKLHCWFKLLCVPTLIILAVKPAIMLPIFGKLIDERLKIDFPAFTSLSIVYAVLMFLLIWSLQKTARKNTIVPN